MGMTKDASDLRKKWRRLTKDYEIYSLEHGRAFYRYRCAVDSAELQSNAKEDLTEAAESGTIKKDEWANDLPPRGQIDLPRGMSKSEFIQQELKVDAKKAEDFEKALTAYSDNDYTDIRAYQRGERVDNLNRIKIISDNLEEYIKRAPRWNGGETFRGVGLTDEQLAAYTIGSEHDMLGVSSWSNEPNIANEFADYYHEEEHKANAVIFHSTTQTRGTAIRHLSKEYSENEVLVSKESRFKVLRRNVDKEGRTHIYLEEV